MLLFCLLLLLVLMIILLLVSPPALALANFRDDIDDHRSEKRPELNDIVFHSACIHLLDFGRPRHFVSLSPIRTELNHKDDVVCKERPESCQ